MRSLHVSQEIQMKAVSPSAASYQYLIDCRWGWEFDFLYLGLSQAGILQSKETLSAYPAGRHIWATFLFIFFYFTDSVVPYFPGAFTSVAGLFLYAHHIGTIQLYRHRYWLCANLFYLVPIRSCLCPVCRQQAHLRQVHRLAR